MTTMASPFRVVQHFTPSQHIREYARATSTEQEETLTLSIKQYIPLDNPNPQPGDVTILGAHANGFPKELYEPLWAEIHARAKHHGFKIRSIWIADVAHQGHSGVLNEELLGNDPSWWDHSRDLLHFINLKRAEIPRPIIGIGHSMGATQLVDLSLLHPRLLTSVILMDPVMHSIPSADAELPPDYKLHDVQSTLYASTYRRDVFPSRSAAAQGMKRNKFYQSWDPRVVDLWIQYGLRDLPTPLHPLPTKSNSNDNNSSPTETPVTLTTTRHQEVFSFSRPNYKCYGEPSIPIDRSTHPDIIPNVKPMGFPFYRPEGPLIFNRLPFLRPSALYLFGEDSDISAPHYKREKLETTGTGPGGSGGVAEGRVSSSTLKNVGHLIPMEAVGESADLCAEWMGKELARWRAEEEKFKAEWAQKSKIEKATMSEEWKRALGPPPQRGGNGGRKKEKKGAEPKL